ncbi:hypothetical protein E1176_07030 [Fulvivirga sp. RKSG066]|uniref:hypothetical protein n=1 Tax=Fulvivirga aurantia TaxID=2529383 RepID=UPI0012BCA19D|nr:hypothetical protein [Fulvivirga aurantia]MTI20769.1 hypothetical protein [Fulvivirga aurantia]
MTEGIIKENGRFLYQKFDKSNVPNNVIYYFEDINRHRNEICSNHGTKINWWHDKRHSSNNIQLFYEGTVIANKRFDSFQEIESILNDWSELTEIEVKNLFIKALLKIIEGLEKQKKLSQEVYKQRDEYKNALQLIQKSLSEVL